MSSIRRTNIKERFIDPRADPAMIPRRVPSAGSREFKINSNASPNTSDIRTKKTMSPLPGTAALSNTIYAAIKKNNYLDENKNVMNNSVGAMMPSRKPVTTIFGGTAPATGNLPLSSIQKKIKDMLNANHNAAQAIQTSYDKSVSSSKRVRASPQNNDSSDKIKRSSQASSNGHKKTPSSTKAELIAKIVRNTETNISERPNTIDLSNKDHYVPNSGKEKKPKLEAKHFIEKTLGRSNINESILKKYHEISEQSKEQLKNNTLYQKFSKKLMASKANDLSMNQDTSIIKKPKSRAGSHTEVQDQSNGVNISNDQGSSSFLYKKRPDSKGRTDLSTSGISSKEPHKRAESENIKKLRSGEFADSKVERDRPPSAAVHRPTSGAQKPPINIPATLTASAITHALHQQSMGVQSTKSSVGPGPLTHKESHSGPNISMAKKKNSLLDTIKKHEPMLPPFEGSKVIIKEFGSIKAFSVNTHQGTIRNYNEDRVSILLNAQQR